jgi:hypothetical protein
VSIAIILPLTASVNTLNWGSSDTVSELLEKFQWQQKQQDCAVVKTSYLSKEMSQKSHNIPFTFVGDALFHSYMMINNSTLDALPAVTT